MIGGEPSFLLIYFFLSTAKNFFQEMTEVAEWLPSNSVHNAWVGASDGNDHITWKRNDDAVQAEFWVGSEQVHEDGNCVEMVITEKLLRLADCDTTMNYVCIVIMNQ